MGGAPFALATDLGVRTRAKDLDLVMHPNARCYVLPCIAGHVGADTAAMILAEAPHQREAMSLLVDVGTNAEIVLGNCDRLLAASSPTGPAFEGAQISGGQRAAPGAIERVRIDPKSLEPRLKIIVLDTCQSRLGAFEELRVMGTEERPKARVCNNCGWNRRCSPVILRCPAFRIEGASIDAAVDTILTSK